MSTTDCINLQDRFGDRYRITFDEDYDPRNRPRDKLDPWMMQIACQRGTIYPQGGNVLAVEVDGRPITIQRLRSLPCCRVHQDGHRETTFLFDMADFDQVAAIVLPRRKRQVSEAERARLAEMSARHGYKPGVKHQSGHPQSSRIDAEAPA